MLCLFAFELILSIISYLPLYFFNCFFVKLNQLINTA